MSKLPKNKLKNSLHKVEVALFEEEYRKTDEYRKTLPPQSPGGLMFSKQHPTDSFDYKLRDLKQAELKNIDDSIKKASKFKNIKLKWKAFSAVFLSLFSIGFLISRLLLPAEVALVKGYEDNSSNNVTTKIITRNAMYQKDLYKILDLVKGLNYKINIKKIENNRQIYISYIFNDGKSKELKAFLGLKADYEGPVTLLYK